MITLSVTPERAEYIAQEDILLNLTVQNTGIVPIELADPSAPTASQPVYFITGPSFPAGIVASARSASEARTGPLPASIQPEMITIPPGGAWNGQAVLTHLFGQLPPGEYLLRTEFEYQGGSRIQSPETQLRVNLAAPVSVDVGQGLRPNDRAQGRLVFLNRSGEATTLMAGKFTETRPDIGEIRTAAPIAQFRAGADATEVSSVWRNVPVFGELIQWTVWREGRQIKAISDASTEPYSLTLPTDPLILVRPTLKLKDQPLEALVVGKDQQIYLCVFPTDLDPKSVPKILWHTRIPAGPDGITAALSPAGNDSRHIAFVASTNSGAEIFHSSYRGSAPSGFQSVGLPGTHVVKAIPPALIVDKTGIARVTVIVQEADKSYSAIEIQFKESGRDGSPEVLHLGSVKDPVVGGRVLYIDNAGELKHREIALVVQENMQNIVLRWTKSGTWKTFPAHVSPVIPMILVPGESFSYVLCFDPKRGFFFEPL